MNCYLRILVVFIVILGLNPAFAKEINPEQNDVIAINIALDPDANMVKFAKAANDRLLRNYPNGFAFDATHSPHITLLQVYANRKKLDDIFSSVDKILIDVKKSNLKLKAMNYGFSPWNGQFLGNISIKPIPEFCQLQQKLTQIIAPFTVKTGSAEAFFTESSDTAVSQTTIDYVATFVSKQSGENFKPHITLGIGSRDFLQKELNQPFKETEFSPTSVSIYQIGNFGTARRKIKEWKLAP